ncbi:MAG: Ig-like domain-containing protein [Pseudomonadota bacterium]
MNRAACPPNLVSMVSRSLLATLQSALLLTTLGLAACQDANTNALAAPVTTTPTLPVVMPPDTPPEPAKAASIEIVQTGLLFTERGQTRQLAARVFDAAGAPTTATVRWLSSDASNISVSSDGIASAERASGSTQITAVVDELRSAPLLAVVTRVAAGTLMVSDEQVLRGVVESNPEAAPSLDNSYTVVLSGIAVPAVDTLLVGTGSAPVAGRVVAAREVPGGVEVTLKPAPLPALFPGLEINQRFDLAQQPAIIPDNVSASYTVQREGNTYAFTPRPENAAAAKAGLGPDGSRILFRGCEGAVNGVGLGDGAAPPFVFEPQPVFSFTIAPALDVLYTEARGLERFLVTASPTFVIDGTVKATAAFEGKVSCKAELLLFRVPVGGALSVVLSGLVPVGVGFELGGKVTLAQLKIGFKSRTTAEAAVGIACEGACRFVNELNNFTNTNTPLLDLPGEEDFRVAPELSAFGYVEANVGNPVFRSLQFKAFEVKAGPKLEGKFAPIASQLAASDFKSSYKLSLGINAGFGDDIESVLNILGVVAVGDEVLELSTDLANSPTGVLTVDRERFATGDLVPFELKLDPAAIAFLGLYNVKDIVLIRNKDGAREVARVAASGSQTTFNFTFMAPDAGMTSEFSAFAVTSLLPSDRLSLELDTATAGNAAPVATDDTASVVQNSSGQTIAVLANDTDANTDPLQVSAVTQPARGTVTSDGQALSYRPAQGFSGTETFRYTVSDGKGGSDEGLVTVEVRALPAAVRLTGGTVGSRADATSCPKVRNGVCASPAPLITEQRFYNETSGIPASDQTSAEAAAEFNGARVNVDTQGHLTVSGSDGSRQIDLRCETNGQGNGNGGDSNNAYGGSSSSLSSINFTIEGEGSLRYQITAVTAAGGAVSPSLGGRASSSVFAGLRDVFEVRHNNIEGTSAEGEATGVLQAGGYSIEVSCVGTVGSEGGPVNSSGSVRLTLMP